MTPRDRVCILLVDDDEHIRVTLGDFLAFEGFEVVLARTGREALQRLETCKPDLILLDIMMPGMDGGDVAQALQAHPRWARVPLIYVTAAISRSEAARRGGLFDGQLILPKPVDLDELLQHIERLVPRAGERNRPPQPASPTSETAVSG
jgi:CheY-like chemotaxis protein